MELKNAVKSFTDGDEGRAVSPVIGVILMVAITVILAAVIGTFVLGLGDRVNQASPNANFGFDYSVANSDTIVEITHDGGESISDSQVSVTVGDNEVYEDESIVGTYDTSDADDGWNDDITAGEALKIDGEGDFSDGDAVKIIWSAEGSDQTAIIGDSEVSV